jgi:ribosomal protein S18 acetylase RimI-like enzyme
MALPILQTTTAAASPADLLRLYERAEARYASQLADGDELSVGVAFVTPDLPHMWDANHIRGVQLLAGMSAESAFEIVSGHFQSKAARCWYWVMNPSASDEQVRPIIDYLLARGYTRRVHHVYQLQAAPAIRPVPPWSNAADAISVIPARAAYRQMTALAKEASARWPDAASQLTDAFIRRLDDPHFDVLLAMKTGQPVASIAILAVGDVGLIEDVYVAENHRRQGLGRMIVARGIELCARTLFKHVFLGVDPTNAVAVRLYQSMGFQRLGEAVAYQAPH